MEQINQQPSPEYKTTLTSIIYSDILQENYFSQDQIENKENLQKCGFQQAQQENVGKFVAFDNDEQDPTKENSKSIRNMSQELIIKYDQSSQESNNSERVESEENSTNNHQINNNVLITTDEDTKANSEEDSPGLKLKDLTNQTQNQEIGVQEEEETKHSVYETLVKETQRRTGKITKDDFSLIQVIGTGSYGKVLLVKKKGTQKFYAMKILKKKQVRSKKQVKNTWTERKILEKISHPFIVKLHYAFHNEKKLFFVLDYCPGGELFFYISQIGRFKEQSAKFYAANVLLALECLHENGIVYRDLKPENILIDKDGYAKLTDFGLSKDNIKGDNLANSFCGTAEYLAPEVLNKQAYGKACDWWSFGCVLYEMLTAIPPFYSKKREEIYNKIRFKNPNFYNFHSKDSIDLISKLLDKDPAKRLGTNGSEEIKRHPFFKDVKWDYMIDKKIMPPYKPLLDATDDTKHFDQELCNMPIESPPDNSQGNRCSSFADGSVNNDDFEGFSFQAQTLISNNNDLPSPTEYY